MASRTIEEQLEKLRGYLAHSKQCAPFYIFNDIQMAELLAQRPTTLAQLSSIKGFPPDGARVAKWGESIINIFKAPDRIEDFQVVDDGTDEPRVVTVFKKSNFFS